MNDVVIHPRITERHPDISQADALAAWNNCIRSVPRLDRRPNEYIAIGPDSSGRLLEMIAVITEDAILIYHAFTPPTKKALTELGFIGGRI